MGVSGEELGVFRTFATYLIMNMQIKVTGPSRLGGRVVLPSSKSISNRALTIRALAGSGEGGEGQRFDVENVSDCDDTRVMLAWLEGWRREGGIGEGKLRHARGDEGRDGEGKLRCAGDDGGRNGDVGVIDVGAAGTAMRFSTALLAVGEGRHVITGSERMKQRPIGILVDALRRLGARVEYVEREGFPPLCIEGNPLMEGGEIELAGNVSSQYISALLMIGPRLKRGLRLKLSDEIVSRPYIDMTLAIMRDFGARAEWEDERSIRVEAHPYRERPYRVESDWSAASYWYEMVALAPNSDAEVVLPGLFAESLQGDSRGAEVFALLGVATEHRGDTVVLRKNGRCVERLDYDFLTMPDLAQTFVVTCCMLGVPFHFIGLQSLKIKETDRIEALKRELAKLGFVLEDRHDSELLWTGMRSEPKSADEIAIDTYEDHRMAMAFAPVALRDGSIRVNNPQVVSKSYPRFWDDLRTVGFEIV